MPKQKKENAGKNIGDLFNSVKRSNWCVLSLPDRDESEEAETVFKECNGWTFSKSNDRKKPYCHRVKKLYRPQTGWIQNVPRYVIWQLLKTKHKDNNLKGAGTVAGRFWEEL